MLERRSRRADRSILLLILIVVIVLGTGAYAILQLRVDQITDSLKKKQPLNTLFIFSDGDKALFFEVFFYNPDTRKGSILYVPPNLGSVIATENVSADKHIFKVGINYLFNVGKGPVVAKY